MFGKLSLRAKLLLAFAMIAGLPTLAGLLGLIELRSLARQQSQVISQTIPAIADVRGIAEESARIIAIAPRLAEVDSQADRREVARHLSEQVDALSARLERLDLDRGAQIDGLRGTMGEVEAALAMLNGLVETRISERAGFRRRVASDLDAARNLLDMADTLVANAEMGTTAGISSLYGSSDPVTGRSVTAETLDKLLEVDLFQLGLMFELRSRIAEVGLLINRIDEAAAQAELDEIQAAFTAQLAVAARRIGAIRDPGRQQQAERHLAEIRSVTHGDISLFDLQRGILATEQRIGALKQELQDAAIRLGEEAAAVADRAQRAAVSSGEIVAQEMKAAQMRNILTAVVGLALSLAVLWFFVRGHIKLRLDRLYGAMTALASGDLDRQVRPKGQDEIARMEEAVEVFRQQAIAKRELEHERDAHERELLNHRNNLQKMVETKTERLRREVEAHDKARREAEAADRAKSEFLAMMSHEIRTPMNGMLGLLHSLSEDNIAPEQGIKLNAALASGHNLLQILNDILDYSKIEKGGVSAVNATFSLHDLVADTIALMRPSAEAKGIRLLLDLPGSTPDAVVGDVAKLRQILFNLFSNAVKFTEEGEVILRVRSAPKGAGHHGFVFEVSDTGLGVSEDAKARVFEAFEQEDSDIGAKFGGTGLGLAISRRFADVIGGRLSLESTKGVGSVFTLSVDMAEGELADLDAQDGTAQGPPATGGLDVLVVEDNEINQMVASAYLERMGHLCQCVPDAETALARLRERCFDAVLMDVNLPGMNGLEATRRIRAAQESGFADIPVIGISAHVQEEQIEAHLRAGMTGFVAKPVSPERLSKALDAALQGQTGGIYLSSRMSSSRNVARITVLHRMHRENVADFGAERANAIIRVLRDQLPEEQDRLEDALRRQDWEALRQTAHRLKGAVGNYDFAEVTEALTALEASAAAGDGARAESRMRELSALLPGLRNSVTALLEGEAQASSAAR